MNYVKKMCILRQIKQGFSGDGKPLSGLIKIEQYGKNIAVEVSIINFAPLSFGEYYCLLSDGKGKTEMLSLRGKSLFNLLTDLDISGGFCGIICYVKNEVVPIAYGINGNGSYDWRSILNATLPPVFPNISEENALSNTDFTEKTDPKTVFLQENLKNEPTMSALSDIPPDDLPPPIPQKQPQDIKAKTNTSAYNDENVATENYYEKDTNHEQIESFENLQNARTKGAAEKQNPPPQSNAEENGNADCVLHAFKTDSDGYYQAVKEELDGLFRTYPRDKTLDGAFSCCEWVRLRGTAKQPQYLVGVLYDDGKAKYICYALAAENKDTPPEEIKNVCAFVPSSVFKDKEGFFVIFQSAATGECVKPERI